MAFRDEQLQAPDTFFARLVTLKQVDPADQMPGQPAKASDIKPPEVPVASATSAAENPLTAKVYMLGALAEALDDAWDAVFYLFSTYFESLRPSALAWPSSLSHLPPFSAPLVSFRLRPKSSAAAACSTGNRRTWLPPRRLEY